MATVRNISSGPRGVYLDGALVMVEPGKTAEADDFAPEWFAEVEGATPAAEPETPAEPGPLDGNVDELTAYLEGVDDPDAVQALIEAETAGKSRKGALAALESRRDELLA
jgi:hypothetical protein